MLAQAAHQLGCRVAILERTAGSPAANSAGRFLIGDWDDPAVLARLGALCDAVTLENEFVDARALEKLERGGARLIPSAACVGLVQDKLEQKRAFARAGVPVARFAPASTFEEARAAAKEWGFPVVLKRRRNAYDGKGNATARTPAELARAWSRLEGDSRPLYAEEYRAFTKELAVVITRGRDGRAAAYPVVETIQSRHVCRVVKAPARVAAGIAKRAARLALKAVEAIGGEGSMGVELFLDADGGLLVNELSPRVHNSGHYTLEACAASQFENHVRAVLGWPLGSTAMRSPAAVMVNLLGDGHGSGAPTGLRDALRIPGAHIHIYGKDRSVPGRKMGHVTALGRSLDEALRTASRAARRIRFGKG